MKGHYLRSVSGLDYGVGPIWISILCSFKLQVCNPIHQRRLPLQGVGNDGIMWKATNNGAFLVQSAYAVQEGYNLIDSDPIFKDIWKWKGMEMIQVFMWVAVSDRLPTNNWRSKWNQSSPICVYCNRANESVLHILRDCEYARSMWYVLLNPILIPEFFSCSLRSWFSLNLKKEFGKFQTGNWNLVWGVAIWKLWLWRNSYSFNEEVEKPRFPAGVILHVWKSYTQIQTLPGEIQLSPLGPLKWEPPGVDWLKLNVDGAVSQITNAAGCGGVVRDNEGNWVAGFSHTLGHCSVLDAEKWALLKSLDLAWNLGCRRLFAESDSKDLIELLNLEEILYAGKLEI